MLEGKASRAEIGAIKEALAAGELTRATGGRSVAVGGSADGAVIQSGDIKNVILPPEILRILLQTSYEPPELEDIGKPQAPGGLPSGSRMVFLRNEKFTGRERGLLRLARDIFEQTGPTLATQSIVGMGGIGKTQLAVEFCYRYGRYFQGVHWLDARSVRGEGSAVEVGGKARFGRWNAQQRSSSSA